jgi:hypothetical protein
MGFPAAKTSRARSVVGAEALPPGTPDWITMELVRETVRVWQPFYSEPISLDEAVTILGRVGRLFSLLSER